MRWQLHWDTNYGMDHRWGWTIVVDGIVMVELEHNLIKAVWRGWREYRRYAKWLKSGEA